jgi:HSP20 family protein
MSDVATGEQQFGNMVRQMGRMMDQLQKGYFSFCPAETWTPPVNLYENDIGYIVVVDLAGVDKEKIDLAVVDGQLRLRGQRAVPVTPDGSDARAMGLRVHLMEIDYGPFCREVGLPNDVAQDKIRATYLNGMLWIELPKT